MDPSQIEILLASTMFDSVQSFLSEEGKKDLELSQITNPTHCGHRLIVTEELSW